MWVWEKMVPKRKLPKSIPLHGQGLNSGANICELEGHVGEKRLNSNQLAIFGLIKKTPLASFPNHILKNI
jgi:hypothetical protein